MVEFEGLDTIIKRLDELTDVNKVEQAINQSTLLVESSAKQNASNCKDTGALQNSIISTVETTNDAVIGYVSTNLEYAPYVEYGTGLFAENGNGRQTPWKYQDDDGNWHTTKGQHPQPFMRPSLSENKQNILRVVKKVVFND